MNLLISLAAVSTCALIGAQVSSSPDQKVPDNAKDTKPIAVGSMLPVVNVKTMEGRTVSLKDAIGGKPAVIVFYRGGWCPYCNAHLAKLREIEGTLRDRGFNIFAVTPDTPEELKKSMMKMEMGYTLLSDSPMAAAKAFGVAFRVDDDTFKMYRDKYQIDLEKSSGEMHHYLPAPSVFIVDRAGIVQFVHSNPDYKVRMSNDAILAAAKRVGTN